VSQRYAVIFEQAESNWAAYVQDLPGCITTGKTLKTFIPPQHVVPPRYPWVTAASAGAACAHSDAAAARVRSSITFTMCSASLPTP